MKVNDKESFLVVLHLVHHLDVVLVHLIVDVLQNLDEQNLDENPASVDVRSVDVVPVLIVVHLDELVWQVVVAFHHQMKMDCYLHVVVVAMMLVEKLEVVLMALQQQVLLVLRELRVALVVLKLISLPLLVTQEANPQLTLV